jgi:hypothetical protein
MRADRILAATCAAALLAACPRKTQAPVPPRAAGTPEARPVHDPKDPAQATAERLCGLLHESIEQRHAACCDAKPRPTFGSLCIQALSAALHAGAVRIEVAAIDRCEAALNQTFAGCEWVAAFSPPLPAACQGLLSGTISMGGLCRSSFECATGLRCAGTGPTDRGHCEAAGPAGAACGGAMDPLGAYVRQDLDLSHPECQGFCNRDHCEKTRALGAECRLDAECGAGAYCSQGQCRGGAPSRKGAPCLGGGCEPGTRCVGGTCIEPKHSGQPCTRELECLGGCLKPDGGSLGVCGPRCT